MRKKTMKAVTAKGSRLEQLKNLAMILAQELDSYTADPDADNRNLPQVSKQYRETIREIEEIEGVNDDDEIGAILSARAADGKSGAVR